MLGRARQAARRSRCTRSPRRHEGAAGWAALDGIGASVFSWRGRGTLFGFWGMKLIESWIPGRTRGYMINYGHVDLDFTDAGVHARDRVGCAADLRSRARRSRMQGSTSIGTLRRPPARLRAVSAAPVCVGSLWRGDCASRCCAHLYRCDEELHHFYTDWPVSTPANFMAAHLRCQDEIHK